MAVEIKKRWQTDKLLISSWIEMGAQFGDVYRQYLINPVIHGLLVSSAWRTASSPIHYVLAEWLDTYCKEGAEPLGGTWYKEWAGKTVDGNTILDLGCGEAYRGRWLSNPSVLYVGVDVSRSLLANAIASKKFRCVVKDLDALNPLENVWPETAPPKWVMAVTLLDQLEHPERLLADIAALYGPRDTGLMLVVTCNPEFYGHSGDEAQPVVARIATVDGDGGGVAYLRSRQRIRKLFRDAGMHVLDEASPHLPARLATKREFDAKKLNLAHSPFVFWLVGIHSTKRERVAGCEVAAWLTELPPTSSEAEAVRALLQQLEPLADQLYWRQFRQGNFVVRRHNLGGRLFVVRSGAFEVDGRNGPSAEDAESSARRRWKFRVNEVFGELELPTDGEQREPLYSSSVVTRQEGPMGHAKALEVPADVTREMIRANSLLGNPFFTLLRRKVLDGLLRYDPASLQGRIAIEKEMAKALERHQTPNDLLQLKASAIVAVASLLLQGLEADRDRGIVRDPRYRVVLVAQLRQALSEVIGRKLDHSDSNRFNRAIRFLSDAGVLRSMRPVETGGGNTESTIGGSQRGTFSSRFKAALVKEEWVAALAPRERKALNQLMGLQSACFFLVDDEIALRKCVMEPSLDLIEDLARRRKTFFPQPADVEQAREADLAGAITEALRIRLASAHWHIDSLGLSMSDA